MVRYIRVFIFLCLGFPSLFAQGPEDYSCTSSSSEGMGGGPDNIEVHGFYESTLRESFDVAVATISSFLEGSLGEHSSYESEALSMGLHFEHLRVSADYEAVLAALRHAYFEFEAFISDHNFEALLLESAGEEVGYYNTLNQHLVQIASALLYRQQFDRARGAHAEDLLYALAFTGIQGALFALSNDSEHQDSEAYWERQSMRSMLALLFVHRLPLEQRMEAWVATRFVWSLRNNVARNLEFIRSGAAPDVIGICYRSGMSAERLLQIRERTDMDLLGVGLRSMVSYLGRHLHVDSPQGMVLITQDELVEHRGMYINRLLYVTERLQQFLRTLNVIDNPSLNSLRNIFSCLAFFIGYSELGDSFAAEHWRFHALQAFVEALDYHATPVHALIPEPTIPLETQEAIPVAVAEGEVDGLDGPDSNEGIGFLDSFLG